MADIAIEEITERESLEAWLQDKPQTWSVFIASRAALRVLPKALSVWNVDFSEEGPRIENKWTLDILRTCLISNLAWKHPSTEIKSAAGDADAALDAADNADGAAAFAFYAATYAGAAAYASPIGNVVSYAALATLAADDADYAADDDAVWENIRQDCGFLEQWRKTDLAMARSPKLWAEDQLAERRQEAEKGFILLLEQDPNWQVWQDWYLSIVDARSPFGLPENAGNQMALKIATQKNEWWDRGAKAVSADIAKWLAEERGDSTGTTLGILVSSASPKTVVDDQGRLDATANEEFDTPEADAELALLPSRIIKHLDELLKALEPINSASLARAAIETYRDELIRSEFTPSIGTLRDAEELITAYADEDAGEWWYSGAPKVSLDHFLKKLHPQLIENYPLDKEREEALKKVVSELRGISDEEISARLTAYLEVVLNAETDNRATSEFARSVKLKTENYQALTRLEKATPNASKEKKDELTTAKKRTFAKAAAGAKDTINTAESAVSLLESDTVKAVIAAGKPLWALLLPGNGGG